MSFILDHNEPEAMFPERIMNRGYSYYHSGNISNLAQSDNGTWMAEVEGTDTYLVTIKPINPDLSECRCTCPYAIDAPCKHIAAVLIAIQGGEMGVDPSLEISPESSTPSDPFESLLNKAGIEDLKRFVEKVAHNDPNIEKQFLSFMTPADPAAGKPHFRKIVKSALAPARRKGLIFSNEANRILTPVYELLDQADEAKNKRSFQLAADISQVILEEMVPALQFIDDSSGIVGDTIHGAITILKEIARESLDENLQKSFFKWSMKSVEDKRYEGWDFPDDILSVAVELAGTEKQVDQVTILLDRIIEKNSKSSDWSSQYHLQQAVLQKIRLLKKLDQHSEVKKLMERFKNLTDIRKSMIQDAWDNNDYQTVKELSIDALENPGTSAPGYIADWLDWCVKASEALGETDEAIHLLEKRFFNRPDMDSYLRLKTFFSEEEWQEYHENLISKIPRHSRAYQLLPEIYLQENRKDRLLDYLKEDPDLRTLQHYDRLFINSALDEIFDLYSICIREYLQQNTGRSHYRNIGNLLSRLYSMGAKEKTLDLAQELKEIHANRPALIEEFDKRIAKLTL